MHLTQPVLALVVASTYIAPAIALAISVPNLGLLRRSPPVPATTQTLKDGYESENDCTVACPQNGYCDWYTSYLGTTHWECMMNTDYSTNGTVPSTGPQQKDPIDPGLRRRQEGSQPRITTQRNQFLDPDDCAASCPKPCNPNADSTQWTCGDNTAADSNAVSDTGSGNSTTGDSSNP